MKAAVWHEGAVQLRVEDVSDPEPLPGSVVIEVEAGFVTGALVQRMSEKPNMIFPPFPFVPGMDTVGRVLAVGDAVEGLAVGERVYCDHFHGTRRGPKPPDRCFLGSFGIDPGCRANMARWKNGNMAEQMMLPVECMTPLGAAADKASAAQLCRMGWYGTAYGGFLNAGLAPGDTVIINGATGMVGASGVLMALAMGAARVVALGRRRAILDTLEALAPARVVPVELSGKAGDAGAVAEAAGEGVAVMLDAVGTGSDPGATMVAIGALGSGGRAAFVGAGLSAPLPLDYSDLMYREISLCGSLWFPREGAAAMLAMVAAGTLDTSATQAETFSLDEANEAVRRAYDGGLGLSHVVMTPG